MLLHQYARKIDASNQRIFESPKRITTPFSFRLSRDQIPETNRCHCAFNGSLIGERREVKLKIVIEGTLCADQISWCLSIAAAGHIEGFGMHDITV